MINCTAYPLNGCAHPQFCKDQCNGRPVKISRETMEALLAKCRDDMRQLREEARPNRALMNEPMTI
jgi:hypothetical protein